MRMKRAVLLLLALLWLLCVPHASMAVPAFPGLVELTDEATGSTVQCALRGDESFSYMVDAEERVVVTDAQGCLRYVIREGSRYALGGYLIADNGDTAIGGTAVKANDRGLQEKLTALLEEIAAQRPMPMDARGAAFDPFPAHYPYMREKNDALYGKLTQYQTYPTAEDYARAGSTIPLLVIRVDYDDVRGAFTDAEWKENIFDKGLTAYYLENSNGKLTYVPAREQSGTPDDGIVTAHLPIACPLYVPELRALEAGVYKGSDGKQYAVQDVPMLFAYAVAAVEGLVDFASYDRNGDGRLDPTELAICLALPGINPSAEIVEQKEPGAWPHSSVIYAGWTTAGGSEYYDLFRLKVDGVEVYKYTMTVENMGTEYLFGKDPDFQKYDYYTREGTPKLTPVGTVCHELGHDLGLADLYNTGGGYTSQNVGGLSLMAMGSWGYRPGEIPGTTPVHLDPYSKRYLGFYQEDTLQTNDRVTLSPASDCANYRFLRINTSNPSVYYLVENRDFSGFDAGLYYHYRMQLPGGLVVWRIDEQVIDATWWENTVNNTEGRYGIMPITFDNTTGTGPRITHFLTPDMDPATLPGTGGVKLDPQRTGANGLTLLIEGLPEASLPGTGDGSQLALWVCALLLSAIFAAAIASRRRKTC